MVLLRPLPSAPQLDVLIDTNVTPARPVLRLRRGPYVEERLLRREFHRVHGPEKKYFTKVTDFVAVSVFANHDGEYIVAGALTHAGGETIAPVFFRRRDFRDAINILWPCGVRAFSV